MPSHFDRRPRLASLQLRIPKHAYDCLGILSIAHHWLALRWLIARFDFTCLVAELVNIPGADEHFDSGYYLFVGRAHCGSVLLPKARFALKLDERISIVSHSIPLTMQAHTFRPNNGSERAPSGLNLGDETTFVHARNPKRGVDARRASRSASRFTASTFRNAIPRIGFGITANGIVIEDA